MKNKILVNIKIIKYNENKICLKYLYSKVKII